MSVGVAHFDGDDQLKTANDRFTALLPLVGRSVKRGMSFRELVDAALYFGQFNLSGQAANTWMDKVLTAYERGAGEPIELKRSDRRWLLFSCRMAAMGHRICNLVDISSQKRLGEYVTDFSEISSTRQIESARRLERMLLLTCSHLNLPSGTILRDVEGELQVMAVASPDGGCEIDFSHLHARLHAADLTQNRHTALVEPLYPETAHANDSLLVARQFESDHMDTGWIVFAGQHWGDGPFDDTDRHIVHLFTEWAGQELARQADQRELEQAHEELRMAASTDSLTGCANRRHFFESVSASRNFHLRVQKPWSVIMLDIDHFKLINDRYGHRAGDTALTALSKTIRQALRDHDIVGRYGGEEFAIFLYNSRKDESLLVAERIRKSVSECVIECDGIQITLTVSLGICCAEAGDCVSIEDSLQRADEALYSAKTNGRNQTCLHQAADEAVAV